MAASALSDTLCGGDYLSRKKSVLSGLWVAFSYFWMFAPFLIIALIPVKMYLGAHWEDFGLSYRSYDSLSYSLDTAVILTALVAFVSIIVNAQFQYRESKDGKS